MSVLIRGWSLRPLHVVLGLALIALVFAPDASGAAPLDTVTAAGGSGAAYSNINISAQSGPSGQNPTGNVAFTINIGRGTVFSISGPVTCLSVTGPDQGAGSPGSPTTAVMNAQDPTLGVVTVMLMDNGGNGSDVINSEDLRRAPTDCSPLNSPFQSTLVNGRAVVFDAPPLPTSKDQCKNGGWRNFPQFTNQGDCVSFIETGK